MSDYDRKEVSTKLNTKNLEFSGRKADFRAWKDVIELYMIGNPSQFPDDERKIAFMLSWMCGSKDVKIWASNQQRQLRENFRRLFRRPGSRSPGQGISHHVQTKRHQGPTLLCYA